MDKVRRRATISFVVVLAAISLAVVPSHAYAQAATSSPFTVSGGVVEVGSPQVYSSSNAAFFQTSQVPLKLENVRYYIVQGSPIGSSHPYSYTVTPNSGIQVGVVELAVNQQNNTHLIEVGTLVGTTSTVVPLSSGSHAIGYKTIWQDPFSADVNWVDSHLNFSYNGSYVTINSTYYKSWWLTETGWTQSSASNWSAYTDRGTVAWSITNAHMHNGTFHVPGCSAPTDVYYNNNNALGYENGNVGGTVYTYATGSCAGFLHYYSIFTTP